MDGIHITSPSGLQFMWRKHDSTLYLENDGSLYPLQAGHMPSFLANQCEGKAAAELDKVTPATTPVLAGCTLEAACGVAAPVSMGTKAKELALAADSSNSTSYVHHLQSAAGTCALACLPNDTLRHIGRHLAMLYKTSAGYTAGLEAAAHLDAAADWLGGAAEAAAALACVGNWAALVIAHGVWMELDLGCASAARFIQLHDTIPVRLFHKQLSSGSKSTPAGRRASSGFTALAHGAASLQQKVEQDSMPATSQAGEQLDLLCQSGSSTRAACEAWQAVESDTSELIVAYEQARHHLVRLADPLYCPVGLYLRQMVIERNRDGLTTLAVTRYGISIGELLTLQPCAPYNTFQRGCLRRASIRKQLTLTQQVYEQGRALAGMALQEAAFATWKYVTPLRLERHFCDVLRQARTQEANTLLQVHRLQIHTLPTTAGIQQFMLNWTAHGLQALTCSDISTLPISLHWAVKVPVQYRAMSAEAAVAHVLNELAKLQMSKKQLRWFQLRSCFSCPSRPARVQMP